MMVEFRSTDDEDDESDACAQLAPWCRFLPLRRTVETG